MLATDTPTIVLRGGLQVPLNALRLLWGLEERGFNITEEDSMLGVSPRSKITAADDIAIRQHRDELLELVRYCETVQ
jgi:hypothetical protein